ncbi:MAG TPA: hypothetical protein VKP69_10600 [Isosphaeraceae bacterium]|nr:hypothetical protein [Isosphaeraceae bacterium]
MSRDYERYVLFDDLADAEAVFDLGKAKLILAGGGESHRDEIVVRTEDDRWVIVHAPLPGVTETGVPAPTRRAIQVEPADISAWCLSDRYGTFDQRGQPVALDGLPDGLLLTLHESRRITDWRRGTRPAPPDRDGPPEAPTDRTAEDDPVGRAAELIQVSPESVRLIRFLDGRPGRKAHLDDIAVELAGASRATASRRRRTLRQRYKRARDLLEKHDAPVRLQIDDNVVELVIGD